MSSEAWRSRVRDIGDRALDQDDDAGRDDLISRECGGDVELRAAVERYVRGADDPLFDPLTPRALNEPRSGQQIGRWTLEQKIGEGGLGVVYRAIRSDGEVRQRGAIKFLRGTIHSGDLEARFRDERQILANLDHPYITGLLDAGVTPDGQPYLVMQLIESGEPLDAYCRRRRCSLDDRLALFQKICEAVSYAHRSHVVHRDLKPANVLVTPDGNPHLLDFGVAKILDPMHRAGAAAAHSSHVLLGTERYFSPEQARMEPLDQSTDVYSLGLILYELLTGTDPYDLESRVKETVQQIVCTVDPELPSSAVKRRGSSANESPGTQLSGDLDAILIQALRKERTQRYSTVDDFRADVERHQNHQPVKARLNTVAYRMSLFVRRNRSAVIAGSSIAVLLLAAAGIGIYEWRQSSRDAANERARSLAQKSAEALPNDSAAALALAVRAVETAPVNGPAYLASEKALHDAMLRPAHRKWPLPEAKAGSGLALSSDGATLAAVDGSSIVIWDVASRQQKRSIDAHDAVSSIAFSADGARLAAGSLGGKATVWDLESGKETITASPHLGAVNFVSFSPDGTLLATIDDGALQVWDAASGRKLLGLIPVYPERPDHPVEEVFALQRGNAPYRERVPMNHEPQITMSWAVIRAFSFHLIAASLEDHGVEIWDLDRMQRGLHLNVDFGGMTVRQAGNNPRGLRIGWDPVTTIFTTIENRTVSLWSPDATRGERSWTDGKTKFGAGLEWTSASPVVRVVFAGTEGDRVAIYSEDHSIQVVDLRYNSELLRVHADRADLNTRGNRLAAADSEGVTVWEVDPQPEPGYIPAPIPGAGLMAVSPDGSMIATEMPHPEPIAVWDSSTGQLLKKIGPQGDREFALAFAGANQLAAIHLGGSAEFWNPHSGEGLPPVKLPIVAFGSTIALNDSGTRVLIMDDTGPTEIWDPRTGEKLASLEGLRKDLDAFIDGAPDLAALSLDGTHAAAWRNRVTRIWNTSSSVPKASIPSSVGVTSLSFRADGKLLAMGCRNGRISIVESETGREVATESAGSTAVSSLAFDALGNRLASGSANGAITIFDAVHGKQLLSLQLLAGFFHPPAEDSASPDTPHSLAFTPNGHRLIIGSESGVRVVTLDRAELLREAHARMDRKN